MKVVMTLCMVPEKQGRQDGIVLGMKKKGFGAGNWNGFGGKVEAGESVDDAALRELHEEACVKATALEKRAIFEFHFDGKEKWYEVHVYRIDGYTGQFRETDEMRPQWFAVDDIPYTQMWPDDRYWLPRFLKGEKLYGVFHFTDEQTIREHELRAVDELS